jgi:enoyl-CoA hydratase/carnithine racemase
MSAGHVRFERAGDVARLTFDRPEARNAMTWEMYQELGHALDRLEAAQDLRVAVLRGEGGRAFVAGTDISQFTRFASAEDGIAYERFIDGLMGRIESVRIPTVAVIEGFAVGGGLAIASACDLRICTPDAKFGLPIARTVGNCLSMRNYAQLIALLGASRAKKMILTAEFLSAEEALQSGFVMEVVPPEQLDERVAALCATLGRNAPITLRVTKEAIRRIVALLVPDGSDLIREAYGSADFREGVSAFVAKRPPVWKGR